ncbi:MAG: DNA-processing protein DprA, partial [Actinomycetota bacterium]
MSPARYRPHPGFFANEPGVVRAQTLQMRVVARGDAEYPELLNEIPTAPERLWVAGRDLREMEPGVAVIGARRANGYGTRIATDLAADLAGSGACIVSGLARGIDAAAHDGALSVGGATIGVLGCGVDLCYPPRSRVLYAEIAAKGTLVSECDPGTRVQKSYLVRRNEILIGLSIAVVVVQGGDESAAV